MKEKFTLEEIAKAIHVSNLDLAVKPVITETRRYFEH